MTRHLVSSLLLICCCQPAPAQELKVFFGNLHSHTSYSDGVQTPKEAYKHARDVAKLDFLAITEHNHHKAGKIATDHALYNGANSNSLIQQAKRFTKDGKFVAIFGQEFSTIGSGNHANVFEIPNVIDEAQVPSGEWRALLENWLPNQSDVHGNQALMLLNHPSIDGSPNDLEYGREEYESDASWRTALNKHAQLINIVNGPSHGGNFPGRPSEGEFRRYLNLGFYLAPTADQDNHKPNWGSAADTRTAVIAEALTKATILKALRQRHVYASEDRSLRVIPRIAGHLIGTRVQGAALPPVGSELPMTIEISDADEPFASYQIEVLADQVGDEETADVVLVTSHEGNGSAAVRGVSYNGGDQYLFFRITQHHDDVSDGDRIWTAPVWFEGGTTSGLPEPTPAPEGTAPVLSLVVDVVAETARVENIGSTQVDLTGWRIVSLHGNQVFSFSNGLILRAGEAVTVVSGPRASHLRTGEVAWSTQNIWRNAGDPGQLLNAQGQTMSTSQ